MRGFNFIFYDVSMRCGTYFIIQISQKLSPQAVLMPAVGMMYQTQYIRRIKIGKGTTKTDISKWQLSSCK